VRPEPRRDNPGVSNPRDELQAAIEARRELGVELEPELVAGFLDRIDRELDRRIDERLAQRAPARAKGREPLLPVTFVSLGVSIPLLGIGGGIAGLSGIIVVCAALVLVNWIVWRST
jgi:hypothetical protein